MRKKKAKGYDNYVLSIYLAFKRKKLSFSLLYVGCFLVMYTLVQR